jgi:hypothetical protein
MANTLNNFEERIPLPPAVSDILLALADGEKHGSKKFIKRNLNQMVVV